MDVRYTPALVTGAGAGLGREVAVALARLGAAVVVADRDRAAADATLAEVRAALGGADILVNNAGGWTEGPDQFPGHPTPTGRAPSTSTCVRRCC